MGSVMPPGGVGSGRLSFEWREWFDFKFDETGFWLRDLVVDVRIVSLELKTVDHYRLRH